MTSKTIVAVVVALSVIGLIFVARTRPDADNGVLAESAPAAATAPATQPETGAATGAAAGATIGAASGGEFKTEEQKASYAIGMDIGKSLKGAPLDLDAEQLIRGLRDVLTGKPTAMTPDQANQVLAGLQQQMMAKQMAKMKEATEKGQAEGKAFLEKNGKVEGVKTTASGLQYQVLKEGAGNSPAAADTVKVHYRGTLLDGSVFDSSYDRGEPAEFPVNRVIAGWTEALQLMKPGAKYKLFIPSNLAYGEQGAGGDIPPHATLVFEVELIEVKAAAPGIAPATP